MARYRGKWRGFRPRARIGGRDRRRGEQRSDLPAVAARESVASTSLPRADGGAAARMASSIEDHKLVGLRREIGRRGVQASAVGGILKVEIDRPGFQAFSDGPGKRRLAHLAGSEKRHAGPMRLFRITSALRRIAYLYPSASRNSWRSGMAKAASPRKKRRFTAASRYEARDHRHRRVCRPAFPFAAAARTYRANEPATWSGDP